MGGIGGRGPGETKLETDRRKSRERMARIRKELDQLRRQRAFTRARRSRQGIPLAALVGYTNAGKSTLLNHLTGAGIPANNRLFDTLDTTSRLLTVSDTLDVVISDTVGFIRKLPHQLVEALRPRWRSWSTRICWCTWWTSPTPAGSSKPGWWRI